MGLDQAGRHRILDIDLLVVIIPKLLQELHCWALAMGGGGLHAHRLQCDGYPQELAEGH